MANQKTIEKINKAFAKANSFIADGIKAGLQDPYRKEREEQLYDEMITRRTSAGCYEEMTVDDIREEFNKCRFIHKGEDGFKQLYALWNASGEIPYDKQLDLGEGLFVIEGVDFLKSPQMFLIRSMD